MNQMIFNDMSGNSTGRWRSPPRAAARKSDPKDPRYSGRGGTNREARSVAVRRRTTAESVIGTATPPLPPPTGCPGGAQGPGAAGEEGSRVPATPALPPQPVVVYARADDATGRRVAALLARLEDEKLAAVASEDYRKVW